MSLSSDDEQNKMRQDMQDLSIFANTLSTKFIGLERLLDHRIKTLEKTIESKDIDRDELRKSIKSLENRLTSMEVTVAKLIGKWSIVILLVTAVVSALVSVNIPEAEAVTKSGLPAAIPPKIELKIDKTDETIYIAD